MSTAEEMEAGRKRNEYFASPGATRPQSKPDLTGKRSGANDLAKNVADFLRRFPNGPAQAFVCWPGPWHQARNAAE